MAGVGKAERALDPKVLDRLSNLGVVARTVVEGFMAGQHRSPYLGSSVEFAQHREYVPGDELRRVDWKVFGRSDKLHLKQYQQETNLDLVILVDSSGSMRYGSRTFEGRCVGCTSDYAEVTRLVPDLGRFIGEDDLIFVADAYNRRIQIFRDIGGAM